MLQVQKMNRDEKRAMYMGCLKEDLVNMLINCEEMIDSLTQIHPFYTIGSDSYCEIYKGNCIGNICSVTQNPLTCSCRKQKRESSELK